MALAFSKYLEKNFDNTNSNVEKLNKNILLAGYLGATLFINFILTGVMAMASLQSQPGTGMLIFAIPFISVAPFFDAIVIILIATIILNLSTNQKQFFIKLTILPIFLFSIYFLIPTFSPLGSCAPRVNSNCVVEIAIAENNEHFCDLTLFPSSCHIKIKENNFEINKVEVDYQPLAFDNYDKPISHSDKHYSGKEVLGVSYHKKNPNGYAKTADIVWLSYKILNIEPSFRSDHDEMERIIEEQKKKFKGAYEKINICGKEAYFGFTSDDWSSSANGGTIQGELIYIFGTYYHLVDIYSQINRQYFPDYAGGNANEIKNRLKADAVKLIELYCETYEN
jgi:hypothetical protein